MSSLRSRLILWTLLGITLCLALSGAAIFASVRSRRYRDLERSLETLLRSLTPMALHEAGRRSHDGFLPPHAREEREGEGFVGLPRRDDIVFQCWLADGETLYRSPALAEDTLHPLTDRPRQVVFADVTLPDGAAGRAAGMHVRFERPRTGLRPRPGPRGGPRRWPYAAEDAALPDPLRPEAPLPDAETDEAEPRSEPERAREPIELDMVVAQDTTELARDLGELRWLLLLGWLTSSLGCAGILRWVVGRSLRPLDGLGAQIEALDEARLDRRLELASAPRELRPIVDRLNEMLARLAQAFEREQTLTAHAAHELRTPLTGLRSTLEVCLARPRAGEEYREAAADCLEITLMMQTMVERLLELHRTREPLYERAALARLVDEAWTPHEELARRRDLTLAREFDPRLEVHTDVESLRRILANLLENAASYADTGGTIELAARCDGAQLGIEVSNPAGAAPEGLERHAFEAFWRADASRTDVGRHAGLGLSLCKRIVESLAGSIDAACEEGRFTVRVRLPVPTAGAATP
jgi:two-component system, OmpR family, heavy metal sensor histidine kinase CusS